MTELNQNTEETLDQLDETLDDLADAPQQKPFPAGAYLVSMSVKRQDKKPSTYIVQMTHKETLELTAATESAPNPGDQSSVFIHTVKKDGTKNELGQGQIKEILKPFGALFNTNSISEILEQLKGGVDCAVVVSVKVDKTGQYADNQVIKSVQVA